MTGPLHFIPGSAATPSATDAAPALLTQTPAAQTVAEVLE